MNPCKTKCFHKTKQDLVRMFQNLYFLLCLNLSAQVRSSSHQFLFILKFDIAGFY